MEIINNYTDKEKWNKFVAANSSPSSFLQSFCWGEFNQTILGNDILRWVVTDAGKIKIACQMIKRDLPGGKFFFYVPRGWVWDVDYPNKRAAAYKHLMREIKAQLQGAVFIRFTSTYPWRDYVAGFMRRMKFSQPEILLHYMEPAETLVVDLGKEKKELLADMHQKTRYNIRLAEKKGVTIDLATLATIKKDIYIFYKLSSETARRNKISIYNRKYYEQLITFFTQRKDSEMKIKLYIARHQSKPLASIMVIYFGDAATYLHGASSSEDREFMANYLLQWRAIQDAKKVGLKLYDFWGISNNKKEWSGITRFKRGFGGQEIRFFGAWDYILRPFWYRTFREARLAHRVFRMIKKILTRI